MKLTVQRKYETPLSVVSEVFLDGQHECFGLEPPYRAMKPHCILAGTYPLTLRESERFGKVVPHVEKVLDFVGVLIHPGNYPKDTQGCLLVGKNFADDYVGESKDAFAELMAKLANAEARKEAIEIQYLDTPDTA